MRKYIVIISVLLLSTLLLLPCSADSMTLKQLLDPGGGDLYIQVSDNTGFHHTAGYSWQNGNRDLVIGGNGDDNMDFILPLFSVRYVNQMGLNYVLNPGDVVRLNGALSLLFDSDQDIAGNDGGKYFEVYFAFMVDDVITWRLATTDFVFTKSTGLFDFSATVNIPNNATRFCGVRFDFSFKDYVTNTNYARLSGRNLDLYVGSLLNAPVYDPADTTDLDNLDQQEKEVLDQTEDGRQEYSTIVNAVRNIFNVTYISAGLLAVSAVLGRLFAVPFIGNLLYISLALGLFAFVLGLAHNVLSRMRGGGR